MHPSRTRRSILAAAAFAFIGALAVAAITFSPAADAADPIKQSRSGICHCPGGDSYEAVTRFEAFDTIEACLEADGRHPKRGQGTCPTTPAGIDPIEHEALKALVATQRAEIAGLLSDVGERDEALADLGGNRDRWRAHAQNQEARAERAEASIDAALAEGRALEAEYAALVNDAKRERRVATTARQEAEQLRDEAAAREYGAGPPARRACRDALRRIVVDAGTGWFSDSVKVDEDGRAALSRACLSP